MVTHPKVQVTSALPLSLLSDAIPRLSRDALEGLVESLIDRLDEIDGDADFEDDDPFGQCDEDGINTGQPVLTLHGNSYAYPGCPISDHEH
ncbi:hypothetical protein [Pelagerythrobacter marensis]|uniref:Uncharacterized protein n=1 Tax=Pelagerythrobacter marensis TaxID=543877 RepID=A0A0G3X4L0_9SPHN|nr:hypothetical protein [Pelagerythrobacter marensis]AKM06127.1 hypothetical protein AM2010_33 [Pelagerythrobacter marensis]